MAITSNRLTQAAGVCAAVAVMPAAFYRAQFHGLLTGLRDIGATLLWVQPIDQPAPTTGHRRFRADRAEALGRLRDQGGTA